MTDDQHREGAPPSGGSRWDPLPQGDYDDGATAFVKLPEGGIEALLAGDSPLAAPGHGYVPPPITAHPGAGEPAHADAWGRPADGRQWPDPNAVPREQVPDDRFTYHPGATQHWTYEEPAAPATPPAPPAPGHDVTGHWSIPVAGGDLPDESGEFTTSALVEQWGGTPPATLPGGAAAPWATEGAGQPWGQPEAAPPQAEHVQHAEHAERFEHAEGFAHEGFAPEGFAPQETYAQSPADQVPPSQHAHGYSGYADDGAEDPAAGHAVTAEDATGHGDAPAQTPGSPADGLAAHGATIETEPAPQAAEAPATADVPVAGDPHGGTGLFGVPGAPGPDEVADMAAPFGTVHTPAPDADAVPDAPGTPGAPDDQAAAAEADTGPDADSEADANDDADASDAGAPADPADQAGPDDAAQDPAPVSPHDDHPLASYVLRVNGADRPVTDAWIGESLLYVLRERLGLAGAKDGCSQGECGACNVQVDGRLVASCLVPAVTSAGSEVRTVEGLAVDGQPSDVQRALARCGAVQCGFCVPGMAMTLHDLLEGNPAPTELETRQALCGNLCRCSGYRGVLDAVQEVVAEREAHHAADAEADGDEARIPHQAGPGAGGVNPSAFDTPSVFDSPGTYGTPGPHDQHYGQDGGQA
ncbi:2Fe-2S iron-sulfur cluster-binding protein [Streptomyces sp. NBC_00820]|uniref:2Fe-2S iron-sulfur cluster-binding protein n=1 Tax=Streptomyces sp. NBC_00820 TaxID=2975842 RepID=UPI002ED60C81|nr:2Fe-2S iron-sulfur cluster-binding protein [Streptomyces sp. NBC_00820]